VPTLKLLPKDKPLVGSASACRVAQELGFKRVYELDHRQSIDLCNGKLRIQATAGWRPVVLFKEGGRGSGRGRARGRGRGREGGRPREGDRGGIPGEGDIEREV
jgi:hypothetical protein